MVQTRQTPNIRMKTRTASKADAVCSQSVALAKAGAQKRMRWTQIDLQHGTIISRSMWHKGADMYYTVQLNNNLGRIMYNNLVIFVDKALLKTIMDEIGIIEFVRLSMMRKRGKL